jgi:hypothetical protein
MLVEDTFFSDSNVRLHAAGGAFHHHGHAHHRFGGVAFGQAEFPN